MRANRWWIAAAAALALAVLVQSSAALRGLARRKGNRAVDLAVRGARRLVPRAWKLGHGLRDGAVMTGEVVSWDGEDRIKRVSRVPVAWRAAALGDDLLEYLRAAVPMFAYEAHELTLERGFNACTDNPDLPGHRYYEGYFHGLAGTARPVRSMNPRNLGHVLKPAAPRALRALVECVRRELAPPLAAALARVVADDEELGGRAPLARGALELTTRGRLFGDLAVQVHAGEAVRARELRWHTDPSNSLVHLALSIRGRRGLHARFAGNTTTAGGRRRGVLARVFARATQTHVSWEKPGDAYITCASAVEHAVEYPRARRWDERIIAIQARFLLDRGLDELRGDSDGWRATMAALTPALAAARVRMPTVAQVRDVERELRAAEESPD